MQVKYYLVKVNAFTIQIHIKDMLKLRVPVLLCIHKRYCKESVFPNCTFKPIQIK